MYNRDYYMKNKDKFKEYNKRYNSKHKDKLKEYYQKYYQENKEDIYTKQKMWRSKNKDVVVKSAMDSRKRRVERLREEGCTNPWSVVVRGCKPKYRKEM